MTFIVPALGLTSHPSVRGPGCGEGRILQLLGSEIDSLGLEASLAEPGREERWAGLGQELHFFLPLAVGRSRQLEIL